MSNGNQFEDQLLGLTSASDSALSISCMQQDGEKWLDVRVPEEVQRVGSVTMVYVGDRAVPCVY